jgi:hypothetical protein
MGGKARHSGSYRREPRPSGLGKVSSNAKAFRPRQNRLLHSLLADIRGVIGLGECIGGDKRPIFLDGIIRGTPVTAQVGETLYYLSAGFLTFNQIDFTSCLSADG